MSEWDAFPVAGSRPSLEGRTRDLVIRTVLGEAEQEPDEGQAAVAAVIRNRVDTGKWGDNPEKVVLAPSQFEPWMTQAGRERMFRVSPDSPEYMRAAANVDRAFGDERFDPTNGSTHFFSPSAQSALGRNPPKWAQGEPLNIGRHSFYAPEGRVARSTDLSSQNAASWDAFPVAPKEEEGGRFTDNPGQSFRTAREGVSEPAPPPTSAMTALGRGAASGLTANFFDELLGLAEAGGRKPDSAEPMTIGQILTGAYKRMSGDQDATKAYEAAVARERQAGTKAREDQPAASILGEIGGAIALPVGAAARGATVGQRAVQGAGVGAAYGGLSGAGSGEDAVSRATGGAIGAGAGAVLGAGAPYAIEGVVRGAQSVARPIANAVRGIRDPEGEAARRVSLAVQRDIAADPQATGRLTPQEFAASYQSGGPATVMDIGGEMTRALARSAANTSPEGRGILNKAINDRFEGQGARVTGWLNDTFNFPNAHAQQQALDKVEQSVNKGAYRQAYREGDKQIWSPELERLVSSPDVKEAMQNAATKGKSRAVAEGFGGFNPSVIVENGMVTFKRGPTGQPTYPNLQFWDYTKRALDDEARSLARAGRDSEAGVVKELAKQLRTELDTHVGSYAAARSGAAQFFKAENALEAGQNFVMQNFNNAQVRQQLAKMNPLERQLFQDGFVDRYIQTLNRVGDRRDILNKVAENPAAREKLQIVLGPQKSTELEAGLRIEGIMDFARKAVQGNSTTARQLTELGLAGGTYSLGTGFDVLNPNPSALMSAALVYGAARGRTRINENVSRKVAEMLVSNDPRLLLKGLKIVSRNNSMMTSLRNFDASLVRSSAGQQPGVPALQSMGIGRAEDDQPNVPRPPGQ